MEDELDKKVMTECLGMRPKTNSYQIDDGSGDKKAKGTKNYTLNQNKGLKMKCKMCNIIDDRIY